MLQSFSLFEADSEISPASIESDHKFTVEEVLWVTDKKKNSDLYTQIIFKILRNPQHLISHIQRIYFTYNLTMNDPLYAALVDLLVVLDGSGKQLSTRMITHTRPLLSEQQYETLTCFLETQNTNKLIENKFTVLTQGLVGVSNLFME
ncbi:MAG: hypothetical protein V3U87_10390 [Methylococcaceae bacterium]